MSTTKNMIKGWLEAGTAKGATHVIVMCDTFDWEDYPVYVMPGESAAERAKKPGSMQRVMECYDLSMDIDAQLAERRAHHY